MIKTYVYVDGFNLYYGALRRTPYKWLNINALCQTILPNNQICKIKYFTANVIPRPNDPQVHIRQAIYLRALRTLPNCEIILGSFLSHNVKMPSVRNPNTLVDVIKTEEKGSDVNLATHLIFDACQDNFDLAIVISNDSDLVEPIKLIRKNLKKKVGVITNTHNRGTRIKKAASFHKDILETHLASSQFPDQLTDQQGTFHKPTTW